jgi:hypothetical protein
MWKDDAGTRPMGMRMAKAVRRACDAREGPAQERGCFCKTASTGGGWRAVLCKMLSHLSLAFRFRSNVPDQSFYSLHRYPGFHAPWKNTQEIIFPNNTTKSVGLKAAYGFITRRVLRPTTHITYVTSLNLFVCKNMGFQKLAMKLRAIETIKDVFFSLSQKSKILFQVKQ